MEILEKLNVKAKDEGLFLTAFTHSSYSNEHNKCESYERLEFLGDKVLDFIVSDYLYRNRHLFEGEMTKIRASYVCEEALSTYSLECGFNEYLRLGHGEELSNGRNNRSILGDVFEAFIGALYIDQGIDIAKRFIYDTVIKSINSNENLFYDYKSQLQELVQTSKKSIEYRVIKEYGPSHDKVFEVNVVVANIVYGTGIGKTKKEAEQNAARDALRKKADV